MKVILLKDVAKIGRRSEIVEVPNGYAQNKLIPGGQAEPASKSNLKKIQKLQADSKAGLEATAEQFEGAMKSLTEAKLVVKTDLNEKGHAFKAVSEEDVVEAAKEAGVVIEAGMIKFDAPIKEAGEHEVNLVAGSNEGKFTLEVTSKD